MIKKITTSISLVFITFLVQSQNNVMESLPCFDRTFSLSIHIVQDEDYMDNITLANVQDMVDDLNEAFLPICIDFEICKSEVLNNHNFSYYEDSIMADEIAVLYNDVPYVNLYLVENIVDPAGTKGVATFSGINIGGDAIIVVNKYSGSVPLIHEMGHFFGLYHTFEYNTFGYELVDGSNCATSGDLICDTPADPDGGIELGCVFVPTQDVNGDYYLPSVANYMSYYQNCRCEFSHLQYWRMANTYLVNPKAHW